MRLWGFVLMYNMYYKLINEIKEFSTLEIKNEGDALHYKILTKTHYANKNNKDLKYTKCILNENKILVINPKREAIFIGSIVEPFYQEEFFPEDFIYNNYHFKKFEKDYQYVLNIEFGNPSIVEGECLWVDYSCEEDEAKCVDMAYVYREKERADILARWIDIKNIKLKN